MCKLVLMMMELYLFLLLSYSSYKMMTCLRQASKKKNYYKKKTGSLRWWTERWILLTCSFKRWVSSLFCGLNHYACRAHSSLALLHRHGNERCHTQTKYCNDWDNTELKQRCATLKFRLVALLSVCLKYEQNRGKIWNRCSLTASAHINENTLVRNVLELFLLTVRIVVFGKRCVFSTPRPYSVLYGSGKCNPTFVHVCICLYFNIYQSIFKR